LDLDLDDFLLFSFLLMLSESLELVLECFFLDLDEELEEELDMINLIFIIFDNFIIIIY